MKLLARLPCATSGLLAAAVAMALPPAARAAAPDTNDYPTASRAEYVFACMAVNGGTSAALNSCSCAIDVIAGIVPYHDYERAETVLRMRQIGGGYLASEFRVQSTNQTLDALRSAEAEAEVRCF